MRRRPFAAVALACVLACTPATARRVVVLGIDGLDPQLLQRFMVAGDLPHFAQLAASGDFKPLQTTVAPQSPVAWSTFITGMDPAGHGIYDFVHRDPRTMSPFLSMSRAVGAARSFEIGSWVLPLSSGRVELLRKGTAFWEILGAHGVPSTLFRMPVNFPPVEAAHHRALSGMGTPDIQGTPGTFSYYTTKPPVNASDFTGGVAYTVRVQGGRVRGRLYGPENPFRRDPRSGAHPQATLDFDVYLDVEARAAKFTVADAEFVLREGEWSEWIRVEFEGVPWLASFSALARFHLQRVAPDFELYVSPLQIDPADPVMPISHPPDWSQSLCACLGYFYTQELPQDTKAFTHGVLSGAEYWDQLMLVHGESRRLAEHILTEDNDEDEEGLTFLYFGSVDQGCHMLWHYTDPAHPGFVDDGVLAGRIRDLYVEMDGVLGHAMAGLDDEATLIVMSDHGFAPFYWGVNLNTWLLENGYVALRDPAAQGRSRLFGNVDWSRTRAYALGLNGLYVNLKGREAQGIVNPGAEYEALLDELEAGLLAMTDPRQGNRAVTLVTRPDRDLQGGELANAPDLIIGYNRGYRSSWENPLGEFPPEVFVDNDRAWSGDHCIDHRIVPGVLLTNRRISIDDPALHDLTVGILDEYGLPAAPGMIGRDCLE